MEPERDIEKLLRAYGEKRHADAGPPPELHPATRRMLQAEVTRQCGVAGESTGWQRICLLLRPRLAPAAGLCALILIGVWMAQSGRQNPALRGIERRMASQAPAPASMAMNTQPAPADLALSGGNGSGVDTGSLSVTNAADGAPGQQRFVRLLTTGKGGAHPANPSTVLASFYVEQNGTEIRFVDRDGSVYIGQIRPAEARAHVRTLSLGDGDGESPVEWLKAAGTAPVYVFDATGRNQTLAQNVMFSGKLTFSKSMNLWGGATPSAPTLSGGDLPLANFRINGTLFLGDTQQVEVQAVAAP